VRTAAIRLLFAAAFTHGFRADSADPGVRAEVRRAVLGPGAHQDDPDVAAFSLGFDLHLTNGSRKPVDLPMSRPGDGDGNSERVAILGVDSEGPDGVWVHLLQGSWYDNGTLTYEPCALLRPGMEGDIRGVKDGFVLLKKQLRGLGEEPTVRLQVTVFCRQPNGRLSAQDVTTDAFKVRLPAK
jgi:hypothetical protein